MRLIQILLAKMTIDTILVADDNKRIRDINKIILGRKYNVITAESGERALHKFKANHNIKLIFSDYDMGQGMNGIDLIKEVKSINPNVGGIIFSGHSEWEIKDIRVADKYVQKPAGLKDIVSAVEEVLNIYKNKKNLQSF
jgi:DNA-binding NtrC family response regulator